MPHEFRNVMTATIYVLIEADLTKLRSLKSLFSIAKVHLGPGTYKLFGMHAELHDLGSFLVAISIHDHIPIPFVDIRFQLRTETNCL